MTPQDHASHLLYVWQSRRHLKPIYRLVEHDAGDVQAAGAGNRRAALAEKDS